MGEIANLIHRRRWQILVHSCIYYKFSSSLIDDYQFDQWAHELEDLQNNYPEIADKSEWAEDFKNWNGSSGAFLPLTHERVMGAAMRLLKIGGGLIDQGGVFNQEVKYSPRKEDSKRDRKSKSTKQRSRSLF